MKQEHTDAPPFGVVVPLKVALKLLGEMSRSRAYQLAERGDLVFVKDGAETLVTTESIERRNAAVPRAKIGKRAVA